MIRYAKIYYFYNSALIRILRLLIFVFLLWLIITSGRIPLFLFSLFLMVEIFFKFKISKTLPIDIRNLKNLGIFESFTLSALRIFVNKYTISSSIKYLLTQKPIQFILKKADIAQNEVPIVDMSYETLSQFAFETAKKANGKFVTSMDVFTSYLLLIEDKTKLIFNKNLKKEVFIKILYWARSTFAHQESPKPYRVHFGGKGIGEEMVFGWIIETKKYMLDLTPQVLQKKPMVLGRDEEYKELLEALYKNKSVILVGEPGSGKTSLVEALAFESFLGDLKNNLNHQRFYQLLVDIFLAGAQNQGELEERLDNLIAEISHGGNLIIFIPDFENILGGSTFHLNLSGSLIPYLERGVIRIIGTSTHGNYKKFIEPMHSLLDVFDVVRFEEPNIDRALQMLFEKASDIERKNNISLTYRAIVAASLYANKYLQGRVMPGAGVTLLEDTVGMVKLANKNIVEEQDVIAKVESKTKIAIGKPSKKEKELLLHLEDKIHKRVIDQKEAVFAIAEGLRRVRAGLQVTQKPISFLFLGPTGVGKTETAKALSSIYFGDESKMIRLDMSEYSTEDGVKRLLGGLPDEEGLTDKVYEHPFSLVLLDEFEKASPKIRDLFLQVLDNGRLTDNKGKTVSFVNTIIIATSNAASEFIREEIKKGRTIDKKFQEDLLEFLQKNNIFKPELLNRFDEIIVFKPLGFKESTEITKLILTEFSKKLLEQDIVVNFDDKLIAKIVKEGINEEFGARPLRRFIQDNIEDLIANKMLKDEIKRGNKVLFSTDAANTITVVVS